MSLFKVFCIDTPYNIELKKKSLYDLHHMIFVNTWSNTILTNKKY